MCTPSPLVPASQFAAVKTSVHIPYKILALSCLLLEYPQHHNSASFLETVWISCHWMPSQLYTFEFHIICINNIADALTYDVWVTLATLNFGLWKGIRVNGSRYGETCNFCLGKICGGWKQLWQPWILDTFAKLWKATVSFIMSVHVEQLSSHGIDFHWTWYLRIFQNLLRKFMFCHNLTSYRYFPWRPMYIHDNICLNSYHEKRFRQKL